MSTLLWWLSSALAIEANDEARTTALCVGISSFQHAQTAPGQLQYADDDARWFCDELVRLSQGRIGNADVRVLTDAQATREAVIASLEWALNDKGADDVVVLYFATHGARWAEDEAVYLLTYDTKLAGRKPATALGMSHIERVLADSQAGTKLWLTDTARPGTALRTPPRTGRHGAEDAWVGRATFAPSIDGEVWSLTAASPGEVGLEHADFCGGHGAFACALVEGLRGSADLQPDGLVSLAELAPYVRARTVARTRHEQSPVYAGLPEQTLVMGAVDPAWVDPSTAELAAEVERAAHTQRQRAQVEWRALGPTPRRQALAAFVRSWSAATVQVRCSRFPVQVPELTLAKTLLAVAPVQEEDPTGWYPMVWVEPGRFTMGGEAAQSAEQAANEVTVTEGYWLGTTEVTQGWWAEVLHGGRNRSNNRECGEGCDAGTLPMEQVSWCDALAFANAASVHEGLQPVYKAPGLELYMRSEACNALAATVEWDREANGYRLPTEEEWEIAARAGTSGRFYWGESEAPEVAGQFAWYRENAADRCWKGQGSDVRRTHPVGTKAPNAWGLHDMSGNVYEWVWGGFGVQPSGTHLLKSKFQGDYQVARGGSWIDPASNLRPADRIRLEPGSHFGSVVGLRLARW